MDRDQRLDELAFSLEVIIDLSVLIAFGAVAPLHTIDVGFESIPAEVGTLPPKQISGSGLGLHSFAEFRPRQSFVAPKTDAADLPLDVLRKLVRARGVGGSALRLEQHKQHDKEKPP